MLKYDKNYDKVGTDSAETCKKIKHYLQHGRSIEKTILFCFKSVHTTILPSVHNNIYTGTKQGDCRCRNIYVANVKRILYMAHNRPLFIYHILTTESIQASFELILISKYGQIVKLELILQKNAKILYTVGNMEYIQKINRRRAYKTFSMLNSPEQQIFPAHKC